MGLFDKAKDLGEIDELADKASDMLDEHGDKIPGGMGDKAKDALDKVDEITDKIPGMGDK